MNRVELYHENPKHVIRKGPLIFLFICVILLCGLLIFKHYYQTAPTAETPKENLGKKVVVQMPNGQEVFTYEKYIVNKKGKTYYKGERNTIDLTGGTIAYKDWK